MARVATYSGLQKWELMAVVAKTLVDWSTSVPGHFVDWAYAARRAESIDLAHAILSRGAQLHPDDGTNSPKIGGGTSGFREENTVVRKLAGKLLSE